MLIPTKIEALPIASLRLCEDNPRTHSGADNVAAGVADRAQG